MTPKRLTTNINGAIPTLSTRYDVKALSRPLAMVPSRVACVRSHHSRARIGFRGEERTNNIKAKYRTRLMKLSGQRCSWIAGNDAYARLYHLYGECLCSISKAYARGHMLESTADLARART